MSSQLRQVPPWRNRQARALAIAMLALAIGWGVVEAVVELTEAHATPLAGHVVSARPYLRKSTRYLDVGYVYTDERGVEQRTDRGLVATLATRLGLHRVGAPVTVKVVLGAPLLQGAPDAGMIAPLAFAGMSLLLALIFLMVDRVQKRKIDLTLTGQLSRGTIDDVSMSSYKGSAITRLRYTFDGRSGTDKTQTLRREGPAAIGMERWPTPGDVVTIAYDASNPERNTVYAFGDDPASAQTTGSLASLPPALTAAAPRPLPPGAPSLGSDGQPLIWVVAGAGAVAAGLAVYASVAGLGAESLTMLVGIGVLCVSTPAALAVVLYRELVGRKRRLLATGVPLAAWVVRAAPVLDGRELLVTFEARTPEGTLRGKERLRRKRIDAMNARPAEGDTMFLVYRPERPWERAVWGFAAKR